MGSLEKLYESASMSSTNLSRINNNDIELNAFNLLLKDTLGYEYNNPISESSMCRNYGTPNTFVGLDSYGCFNENKFIKLSRSYEPSKLNYKEDYYQKIKEYVLQNNIVDLKNINIFKERFNLNDMDTLWSNVVKHLGNMEISHENINNYFYVYLYKDDILLYDRLLVTCNRYQKLCLMLLATYNNPDYLDTVTLSNIFKYIKHTKTVYDYNLFEFILKNEDLRYLRYSMHMALHALLTGELYYYNSDIPIVHRLYNKLGDIPFSLQDYDKYSYYNDVITRRLLYGLAVNPSELYVSDKLIEEFYINRFDKSIIHMMKYDEPTLWRFIEIFKRTNFKDVKYFFKGVNRFGLSYETTINEIDLLRMLRANYYDITCYSTRYYSWNHIILIELSKLNNMKCTTILLNANSFDEAYLFYTLEYCYDIDVLQYANLEYNDILSMVSRSGIKPKEDKQFMTIDYNIDLYSSNPKYLETSMCCTLVGRQPTELDFKCKNFAIRKTILYFYTMILHGKQFLWSLVDNEELVKNYYFIIDKFIKTNNMSLYNTNCLPVLSMFTDNMWFELWLHLTGKIVLPLEDYNRHFYVTVPLLDSSYLNNDKMKAFVDSYESFSPINRLANNYIKCFMQEGSYSWEIINSISKESHKLYRFDFNKEYMEYVDSMSYYQNLFK